MIEWLMELVAVAWVCAMLIMLLKVLDDPGTVPSDGGSIAPAHDIRSTTRAHRGNARALGVGARHARHLRPTEEADRGRRRIVADLQCEPEVFRSRLAAQLHDRRPGSSG